MYIILYNKKFNFSKKIFHFLIKIYKNFRLSVNITLLIWIKLILSVKKFNKLTLITLIYNY